MSTSFVRYEFRAYEVHEYDVHEYELSIRAHVPARDGGHTPRHDEPSAPAEELRILDAELRQLDLRRAVLLRRRAWLVHTLRAAAAPQPAQGTGAAPGGPPPARPPVPPPADRRPPRPACRTCCWCSAVYC